MSRVTSTLPVFEQSVPAPRAAAGAADGRADAAGARNPICISRNLTASRAGTPRANDRREALQERSGARAAVRRRRRPAARRTRPDRQRRRHPRLRRPARDRAAGRGRLHAGRSDPHRDPQRRDLPGPRRPHRLDRAGQERRPVHRQGQSGGEHRRRRECRDRVQGRRRLRQRQAAAVGEGALRPILAAVIKLKLCHHG